MNTILEQKIGFDKIRTLLKSRCVSPIGEEEVEKMKFSTDYFFISQRLDETNEMTRLLMEEEAFPLGNIYDLREGLFRIKIEGLYLDAGELFDLQRSLLTIATIVSFLEKKSEIEYPALKLMVAEVLTFKDVTDRIGLILDKFGKIKDNASNELLRIRREIHTMQASVSRSLNSILRQAKEDGLVDKDTQPTMREGRLVIPVPPAYKRQLKGIVHDESASGKTVFIEPAAVVENNNRLRELESEERREIIRILIDFSNFLRPYLSDIFESYDFLAKIDFVRAKALLAIELKSIRPIVHDKCIIQWFSARHPLLFFSLQKQGKEIVPLDIKLNEKQRILIISGPNAGGKSVCLKTTGLIQYMLQCGLMTPISDDSEMGIFEKIFIDIGDEQSIENDLSTYSSHLTNMKLFARQANAKTLLLIDEFGGGTEPQIGGAIAEALLERFNFLKVFAVITTHYSNLKHFAEDAEGIVNGAMLYDRHLMQPLFQLQIGNPGSSFAIEIARKIGLPEEVVLAAIQKVGEDTINFDRHLQDIVRDKRYWENKRQQIRQREKRIEELEQQYLLELESISKQRKEIVRKAKKEAQDILSTTNATIENTIRKIKESQADKEKTKEARSSLQNLKNQLQEESTSDDLISRKIEKLQKKKDARKSSKIKNSEKEEIQFAKGMTVRVKGQSIVGEIFEIQGNKAIVIFGTIKTNVKTTDLELVDKKQLRNIERKSQPAISSVNENLRQRKLQFKTDIDIRGMRVDEALQAVMYFIDDAQMIGVSSVRILHGTGHGILRDVVRQYLSSISGIVAYHDEHIQLGGSGITVVNLG